MQPGTHECIVFVTDLHSAMFLGACLSHGHAVVFRGAVGVHVLQSCLQSEWCWHVAFHLEQPSAGCRLQQGRRVVLLEGHVSSGSGVWVSGEQLSRSRWHPPLLVLLLHQ